MKQLFQSSKCSVTPLQIRVFGAPEATCKFEKELEKTCICGLEVRGDANNDCEVSINEVIIADKEV